MKISESISISLFIPVLFYSFEPVVEVPFE